MSGSVVSIIQTFILKGVDVSKVIKDYQLGFYTRPIQKVKKNEYKSKKIVISKQISKKREDGVYIEKYDNYPSRISLIFVASNHKTNLKYINEKQFETGIPCMNVYCRKIIEKDPVGYAVKYERKEYIKEINGNKVYKIFHIFWTKDNCCSFGCSYNRIIQLRGTIGWDDEYSSLTKLMYSLYYPNSEELYNINDPSLLKYNGGSLEEEDYKKNIYIKMPGIVLAPISEDYLKF